MTDTENKLRDDAKALQESQYIEEIREMLKRFGVPEDEILNIETNEDIPKLMEAKDLVEKLGSTELFEREENGTYKIYAKITALSLLSASVGMMDDLGVGIPGTPFFAGVHRWLGVPIDTLRRWWSNQNLILREEISLGSAAVQRIVLKQLEIAEFYTDGLKITKEQRDKLAETPKGIIVMQKTAQGALLMAKFLSTQGEAITKADQLKKVTEAGIKHNVTVIMPIQTVRPVKKYKKIQGKEVDGDNVTD